MKAMVLRALAPLSDEPRPLSLEDIPEPSPGDDEVLIRVRVCGVCHTELDEIEGRTPPPALPVVPGHQAVGVVEDRGSKVTDLDIGTRVGVGWIFSACGDCHHCRAGDENLCAGFLATGRDRNGGYAEYMTVPASHACPVPDQLDELHTAPLLCAGAIGYRSLRLTAIENGQRLGLTGFGASGHLVLKMARYLYPDTDVYVFARSELERNFALELGARWAGDTGDQPPEPLHAIIDTTPVWRPVIASLANLEPGGRLVINAIRKEETDKSLMAGIDYTKHLWMEKEIKSVANVARRDIMEFLELAAKTKISPELQTYALEDANRALVELKQGNVKGAKVLVTGA